MEICKESRFKIGTISCENLQDSPNFQIEISQTATFPDIPPDFYQRPDHVVTDSEIKCCTSLACADDPLLNQGQICAKFTITKCIRWPTDILAIVKSTLKPLDRMSL